MKLNKGFAPIAIVLIIIAVLAVGGVAYFAGKSSNPLPQNVVPDNYQSSGNQNNAVTLPVQNASVNTNATTACNSNSPTTIKVLSPNGGEVYQAGQQVTVKWESCNVTPNSIGIILIKHNPSVAYTQSEGQGDYAGFTLGGFNSYTGTADDGSEQVTLPSASVTGFTSGQHYFIAVTGLGDNTHIGSGYAPRDYSDNLFTINAPQISSANWKTYTNTGCGYSFQYPNSWSQWGNESNATNLQGGIMGRIIDFMDTASQGIERSDGNNNQIVAAKDHMHVECYTMGTSVYNDELSRYNNSSDIFAQNKKTIIVAGQTAIIGEMKDTATVSGGEHPGHIIIPSHNMYVFFLHKDQTRALYFEFDTPLGIGDVTELANFEQVLKTFKFN